MSDTTAVSLNGLDDLGTEEIPSLADFADEPGGAWPKGWYSATIIEGYSTRKGKQFVTSDEPSKDGNSRNMRLCLSVSKPGADARTMQESLNYRVTDFTPERLAHIKEMRVEFKGVKGRWADADAQRSSLAVAKLGQLEKALGFRFKRSSNGALIPAAFVGQSLDIYLNVDEEGYNEVKQFDKAGNKVKAPKA